MLDDLDQKVAEVGGACTSQDSRMGPTGAGMTRGSTSGARWCAKADPDGVMQSDLGRRLDCAESTTRVGGPGADHRDLGAMEITNDADWLGSSKKHPDAGRSS